MVIPTKEEYGTLSRRQTKASIIYKTGNLRAIQNLGHSKIENTVSYLGGKRSFLLCAPNGKALIAIDTSKMDSSFMLHLRTKRRTIDERSILCRSRNCVLLLSMKAPCARL